MGSPERLPIYLEVNVRGMNIVDRLRAVTALTPNGENLHETRLQAAVCFNGESKLRFAVASGKMNSCPSPSPIPQPCCPCGAAD